MTTKQTHTLFLAALSFTAGCSSITPPLKSETAPTFELAWLLGCWITKDGATEESWHRSIEGSLLFGYSVTRTTNDTPFFEQLRLEESDDGWQLSAYPLGEGPTRFRGRLRKPKELVLENSAHDYPQRISYQSTATGLSASVSLLDGTKAGRWSYIPCPM